MQANGVVPNDDDWFLGCDITVKTTLGEVRPFLNTSLHPISSGIFRDDFHF